MTIKNILFVVKRMVDKCTQIDLPMLNRMYDDFESMSVRVKRLPNKGLSLVAQKDIPRGRVVAYYRTVLAPATNRCFNYQFSEPKPPKGKARVLDVEQHGLVKYGIPYVAMFSNEPSQGQEPNCDIDVVKRKPSKEHMDYKLITTRAVPAGAELTWCYELHYPRKYKSPCSSPKYY
jgi:hypothetical protein